GRKPVTASPRATPTKAFSQIGVLITRPVPKRSARPSFVLNTPPVPPTSSPISSTRSSAAISSSSAAPMAWRYVSSTACGVAVGTGSTCVDIAPGVLERRERRPRGALGRLVDLGLHDLGELAPATSGEHPPLDQRPLDELHRVALLPGVELAGRAVAAGVGPGVAAVAVGLHLEQARPVAGPRAGHRTGDRGVHRRDVLAVDDDARDP